MKLNELINPFFEKGFFQALYDFETIRPIWLSDGMLAITLDFEYIFNHSGDKTVSPLIEKMYQLVLSGDLTPNDFMTQIVAMFYPRFNKKWDRLYNIYNASYNTLENANLTEMSNDTTTENGNFTEDADTSDTTTYNTQDTVTGITTEGTTINTGYAFNSDGNGSPLNKQTDTNEQNGENAHTGTDTNIKNIAQTGTNEKITETAHTYNRHGSIGVVTPQTMLQQEVTLWTAFDFFGELYRDIDTIFTLNIYE